MSILRASARSGIAAPTLFVLAAFAAFLALGTWQVERKAQKEAFIAMLDQRLSASPASLPSPEDWAGLDRAANEFRHVRFSASFVPGAQALVYAGTSGSPEALGPGYRVFAAARLGDGNLVVVDRGFVPAEHRMPDTVLRTEAVDRIDGSSIDMVGVIRWPERRSYFTPNDDPARGLWFLRDHLAIAAAKGWGAVAPFSVELEAPIPPTGWPRPGRPLPSPRNEHLQYAVAWYGLAAAVAIMFAFWVRNRSRHG
jgi:cytochrome oxidase assembly protein ShyY1